ncbi:MAG: exonuclease subunit SbcD [Syntrophomonas sp.]
MKIIHTSDWHIGRSLYGRKRYDEFEAFLNWLAEYIKSEEIEVLLVSGDIFDNIAPSNRAQELYYQFLCNVVGSHCRHVVVTGGNHDSPSFLNAPREVLRFLNVNVIGCMSESATDEVLVLSDKQGEPELIICAVPYLRDRDVRRAEAGESYEEKGRKLVEGIRSHYAAVCEKAERIKQ